MNIKNTNISVEDAIKYANHNDYILKRRENNMLFSDFQINVLNKNGLNYLKYSNIHDLLFDIEDILNDDFDDELDLVSSQIAEYLYYSETKK